jgi:hypothetical protein
MRIILVDVTANVAAILPRLSDSSYINYVVYIRTANKDDVRKLISSASCVTFYCSSLAYAFLTKHFPELKSKPDCGDLTIDDGDVVIIYRPSLLIILEYRRLSQTPDQSSDR